jgi:DNA-binding response OmpR family regulator
MRTLLIEDIADGRLVLAEWLKDKGLEVIEADSFASAKTTFQQEAECCEAVITDVLLPDGNGQDLAELVRPAGVPVLLCTGDANSLNGLHDQGLQYLSKPFRFEALAARLADICPHSDRLVKRMSR